MNVDYITNLVSKAAGQRTPAAEVSFEDLKTYIDIFQKEIDEDTAEKALKTWVTDDFQPHHANALLHSIIVKFGEGHRIWGKYESHYTDNLVQINQQLQEAYEFSANNNENAALNSIHRILGLGRQSYSTKVLRFFNPDFVVLDSILKAELGLGDDDYYQIRANCRNIAAASGRTPCDVESGIFAWVQILNLKQRRKRWRKYQWLPRETLMATFEQHCAQALETFGQSYADVHRWLDEFAGQPPYGMRHRKKRHHLAGIEEVRKLWGDKACAAARQHIITDLKQEGWRETDPFPRDEDHYQRMGLF